LSADGNDEAAFTAGDFFVRHS